MNEPDWLEGERPEFARSRTDEAFRDIASFAKGHGGTVHLGVNDAGTVVRFDETAEVPRAQPALYAASNSWVSPP